MGPFIQFEEIPTDATRRTKIWRVRSAGSGTVLGQVSWFAHWRRYTFTPEAGMVFDAACLSEVDT